ncbi:MAG: dockerin type I repeat-containing protein [Clostridia bacterium]|nr:dockerin type I repeat-containing protein [Clostridia bacterium]
MKRKILITLSLMLVASMLSSFGAYATEKTNEKTLSTNGKSQIVTYDQSTEKDDHSELLFELMDNFIEINEHHAGLITSTYRLLGTTSNGYHIAYCRYHYGDNIDLDFSQYQTFKTDEYVIIGDGYPNRPSRFGIYCFDNKSYFTIEDAYMNNGDKLPLDEVTAILKQDNSLRLNVYNKKAESEKTFEACLDYFEKQNKNFSEVYDPNSYLYLGKILTFDNHETDIFYLTSTQAKVEVTMNQLGDYVFFNQYSDPLNPTGIYLLNDGKLYNLDSENTKFINYEFSLVADFAETAGIYVMLEELGIDNIPRPCYGDADHDGKINMSDVTTIQKHIAELNDFTICLSCADVNGDGVSLEDVVCVQKYLASLKSDSECGYIAGTYAGLVPRKLDAHTKEEISKAYLGYNPISEDRKDYINENYDDLVNIRYFDKLSDGTLMVIADYMDSGYPAIVCQIELSGRSWGNYIYHASSPGNVIYLFKDGKYISIKDALEQGGILTEKTFNELVFKLHMERRS